MGRLDFDDELEEDLRKTQKLPSQMYLKYGIMAVVVLLVIIVGSIWMRLEKKEETLDVEMNGQIQTELQGSEVIDTEKLNEQDIQTQDSKEQTENIAATENETVTESETPIELLIAGTIPQTTAETRGVDVSKYQGVIAWEKVAQQGIDFAMIRVGYRSMDTGVIYEDELAKYNMQEASKYGIKLGVYFFSTAITEAEAREEADWAANLISRYSITYPVAYDCEGFDTEENRHSHLSKEERSRLAQVFMDRIYEHGYTPMFYAAKSELTGNANWETSVLEKRYSVWVSHYSGVEKTDYTGQYRMWQYTNQGSIEGISGKVDLNTAYFGYDGVEAPHSNVLPEHVSPSADVLMHFSEVEEIVTAKNKTNLRDMPSQGDDSTVMVQLVNGDTAVRTGVSDTGWSRVEYNGNIYYAVSSYLTTDLNAPAQQATPADDGIKTEFTPCNDIVTAKIEVNLRTLPSVTNADSQVVATLYNGENITRTGINTDHGWSRVEYNGQTLYCVSSYLQVAQ